MHPRHEEVHLLWLDHLAHDFLAELAEIIVRGRGIRYDHAFLVQITYDDPVKRVFLQVIHPYHTHMVQRLDFPSFLGLIREL